MFIWVKLNNIKNSAYVHHKCLEQKVLVCKGEDFYSQDDIVSNELRLSYSNFDPEKLDNAVKCLRDVILEAQSLNV